MLRPRYSIKALRVVAVALAIVSIGIAALVIAQRAGSGRRRTPVRTGSSANGQRTAGARQATARTPIRPADPNRAPQAAVDQALYTNEEFFGTSASVARPYATALGLLETLLTQYPKDAQLRLHAARLAERLGQVDRAAAEMNTYADLKKRSPDSL